MSTIDKLVTETRKAFGRPVRLWLTELGYQSNPPDRLAGVPLSDAGDVHRGCRLSRVAHAARRPSDPVPLPRRARHDRWQSGLETRAGKAKLAMAGVRGPLAEVARRGSMTTVWGMIRPGSGARPYRLQRLGEAGWVTVGGVQRTKTDGTLRRVVTAGVGVRLRLLAGAGGQHPGRPLGLARGHERDGDERARRRRRTAAARAVPGGRRRRAERS